MKKLLALAFVVLMVFVWLNRMRLYVRDPLAKVTADGAPVGGTKVMINYANDVLLFHDDDGVYGVTLLQHWNKVAATPTAVMKCLYGTACLLDAEQATAAPIVMGSRGVREKFEGVTMTDRRVEFVNETGALVQVMLR